MLNLISPFFHRAPISDPANWENIMMNGTLLVFFSIIHDSNNTMFSAGNDACVRMRHWQWQATYYGKSDVMNVLEQLKLNLNYITCFECTSPDIPAFNILSELFRSTKFIAVEGERGFKILSERNAKFMNTHLTSQLDLCEIIIHYLMLKHS